MTTTDDAGKEVPSPAFPDGDPLQRYILRRGTSKLASVPDTDLLLLSIALDTREMLILARHNQAFIDQTMMQTQEMTNEQPERTEDDADPYPNGNISDL